jgi:hypothetical protein
MERAKRAHVSCTWFGAIGLTTRTTRRSGGFTRMSWRTFSAFPALEIVTENVLSDADAPRSGFDELASVMPHAWGVASRSSAAEWLGLQDDEVHEGYTFTVLQPATAR